MGPGNQRGGLKKRGLGHVPRGVQNALGNWPRGGFKEGPKGNFPGAFPGIWGPGLWNLEGNLSATAKAKAPFGNLAPLCNTPVAEALGFGPTKTARRVPHRFLGRVWNTIGGVQHSWLGTKGDISQRISREHLCAPFCHVVPPGRRINISLDKTAGGAFLIAGEKQQPGIGGSPGLRCEYLPTGYSLGRVKPSGR